VKLLLLPVVLL